MGEKNHGLTIPFIPIKRYMDKAVYWTIPSSAKKLQLAPTFQSEVPSEGGYYSFRSPSRRGR